MFIYFAIGFGIGCGITAAALVYRFAKTDLTCSGILAIGSSNEMFLDLKEPVEEVRKHGIIHLKVNCIDTGE